MGHTGVLQIVFRDKICRYADGMLNLGSQVVHYTIECFKRDCLLYNTVLGLFDYNVIVKDINKNRHVIRRKIIDHANVSMPTNLFRNENVLR